MSSWGEAKDHDRWLARMLVSGPDTPVSKGCLGCLWAARRGQTGLNLRSSAVAEFAELQKFEPGPRIPDTSSSPGLPCWQRALLSLSCCHNTSEPARAGLTRAWAEAVFAHHTALASRCAKACCDCRSSEASVSCSESSVVRRLALFGNRYSLRNSS